MSTVSARSVRATVSILAMFASMAVLVLGIGHRSIEVITLGAILMLGAALARPWYSSAIVGRSAVGLVVPIFVLYTALSATIARTDTLVVQLWLVFGAATFFTFGALFVSPSPPRLADSSPPPIAVRSGWFALVFLIGATAAIFAYSQYGVPVLSDQVASARLDALENGYLGTTLVTCLSASLVLAAIKFLESGSWRRRAIWMLPALISFALLFGFGSRGLYFVPILVILAYAILQRPRRIIFAGAFGALLLVLISVAGFVRDLQLFGPSHLEVLEGQGVPTELAFLGPIFTYFRGTSTAIDQIIQVFPSRVPHPGGEVFFGAILSPLPGEQITAGVFLKNALGLDFVGSGLASGAVGGFYMDFGPIGVLVGFLIFGIIARWAQIRSWGSARGLTFYACVVSHLWFINYAHPLPFFTTITIPAVLLLLQRANNTSGFRRAPVRLHANRLSSAIR